MGLKHVPNLDRILEYSSELGVLQGYEFLGACMSFAFLHAAPHILLMDNLLLINAAD